MAINIEQQVVILDPGLREFGGHHPALIAGLSESLAVKQASLAIKVYANKACSEKLIAALTDKNTEITPYFKTDFYLNFYSNTKLNTYNAYISNLAKEYLSVLSLYENSSTTFLFHTLNWEHAYALSLAINSVQQQGGVKHTYLVCLMYNPYYAHVDSVQANNRYFQFTIGFSMLEKQNNVFLYAAEHELMGNYQEMLQCDIGWHPCGLISHQNLEAAEQYKKETTNILLYLGDAKDTKGFLQLPDVVKALIHEISDPKVKFTLQYTITNNRQDLAQVDKALKQLQFEDKRIEILSHFLNDDEMHQLWLYTTHTILNYDSVAYQNQSSGVLWLAAAYQTTTYLMSESWLNREAKRLNITHHFIPNVKQLVQQLQSDLYQSEQSTGNCLKQNGNRKNEYKQNLFLDFGSWLVTQMKRHK